MLNVFKHNWHTLSNVNELGGGFVFNENCWHKQFGYHVQGAALISFTSRFNSILAECGYIDHYLLPKWDT